jgi:hypothetical protein
MNHQLLFHHFSPPCGNRAIGDGNLPLP